ncbi:hypothetical protein [Nocardia sp. BMG51109]|uniref:hypothetical protein n=1 Tax=Nocardia sp. BMG51109 TaxID=1056816 RepID=UPI0004669A19|nr:hypothetical protein [Nocardia sp. BMG51109]
MNRGQYISDRRISPENLADLLSSIDIGERALRGTTIDIFAIASEPAEFGEHPTVLPPDGVESPVRVAALSEDERAELRSLRSENDELRRANRKLVVASRYFAARSRPPVFE